MLKLQAAFNASLTNTKLDYMYSPYTQWQAVLGTNGFDRGTVGEWFKTTGATVLFLLLPPALNIIGITLTQFRKRRSEIGVRKAFGARSFSLVEQVMTEKSADLLHRWADRTGVVIRPVISLQVIFLFGNYCSDARYADTALHFCCGFLFHAVTEFAECRDPRLGGPHGCLLQRRCMIWNNFKNKDPL